MSDLDQAHDRVKALYKRHLEINPGLESVERRAEYPAMIKRTHRAFTDQINAFLKSGVFAQIDRALHPVGKAERISTDSDDLEIEDAVDENLPPIATQDDGAFVDAFLVYLILVYNLGGQDFLNKQNIPATFDLTNTNILSGLSSQARQTLKGIDQTTADWIVEQISTGRALGMSNAEIADLIRSAVPNTYANRAEAIVRTETSRMVGQSEHQTASYNGASHKAWVTVAGACPICQDNEGVGTIGIGELFPSGDENEPAHVNCRCLVEYEFTPFMGTIWSGD